MQITFTKDEIKDILIREAQIMIDSYHVGTAKYDLSTIYLSNVSIDIELLPYEELEITDPELEEPGYGAIKDEYDDEERMERIERKERHADYSDLSKEDL